MTLVETGEATASFIADGINIGTDIMAEHGDTLTISYVDEDDGQGGTDVETTDTATVDCELPVILAVEILEVNTHDATVRITTSEATVATVLFGASCNSLADEALSNDVSTVHEVQVTGLVDNATYLFAAGSTDLAGNEVWDDNNGSCYTFTTADIPSYFTEQNNGFDMDGMSITLTPYTNVDEYRACAEPITALPTNPNTGTVVNLSDDDSESMFAGGVILYGETYTSLYICSNGRITFNGGSSDYTETINEHFAIPGISMLWGRLKS